MKTRWYQQVIAFVLVLALFIQVLPLQAIATASYSNSANVFTKGELSPLTVIREEDALRTETEKHFLMSDGSFMAVSYGTPVHYQDENGAWQDIDNTLTASITQTEYSINNTQFETSFASNLSAESLMTTQYKDTSVSMSLLDTAQANSLIRTNQLTSASEVTEEIPLAVYNRSAEADVSDTAEVAIIMLDTDTGWNVTDIVPATLQSSVLYENVFPDVDLLYTAYGYIIKEQIVVEKTQSAYRYDFLFELDGVSSVLNDSGSVSFVNEDNEEIYYIPAPFMEDASGNISYEVHYTLHPVTGGVVLCVEADANWMNDETRVYPVTIDPTIIVQAGSSQNDIYTSFVSEETPDVSYGGDSNLYLGYSGQTEVYETRGFAHFNSLPSIPSGAVVTEALFGLYMHDYIHTNCSDMDVCVYEVTGEKPATAESYSDWISNLTWNTMPTYSTTNMIDYAMVTNSLQDQYYCWEITELVKKWYTGGTENRTIAMTADSCSDSCFAQSVFCTWGYGKPPMLFVSYRSVLGLEDYYSYASLGLGAAGTAYISDFTGQLTVKNELVSYASGINPFSLNLVYNSNYKSNSDLDSDYPSEEVIDARIGVGWTLDILQSVNIELISNAAHIRYRDGDGTVHYLRQDPDKPDHKVYYDEDGLGLCLTVDRFTMSYLLSDSQGSVYTFRDGLLRSIQDDNGNQYILNYEGGNLSSIGQKNAGIEAETTVASFTYTDDYLSAVTNAAGQTYTLNYTEDRLTSITMGTTVLAEYEYDGDCLVNTVDSESGYTLSFEYDAQNRISWYAEKDKNGQLGSQVAISYSELDRTTYRDYGSDRTADTDDDILTHYLFDNSGRTVNAYTTDKNGGILGASNAIYFSGTEIDRRNNRTVRTASIGVAAEQELLNSGFEDTSNNTWTYNSGASSRTDKPRTGNRSLRVNATSDADVICASKNSQTLYSGVTYTLSGYVNTVLAGANSTCGVYLMVQDTSGNTWRSNHFDYQTSQNVDDGWCRMSVTFTAQVTGVHTVAVCSIGSIGVFYFDDLQLERGNAPSNRNLLENGNMQANVYGWTLGASSHPTISYAMPRENDVSYALEIPSAPSNGEAKVMQEVPINLSGVETCVLSGWAKGNAVPDNVATTEDPAQDAEKTFGLRATLNYADGTKEYFYAPFSPEVSDWQFTSVAIVPSNIGKTISTITVACVYEHNANTAYFDNISLVRETVQTMSYDTEGNLTSISTTGMASDTNSYESGNLIEAVTGTGSTYSFTYDENYEHRLLSYTDGLTTQTMAYDAVGNVTSSTYAANEDASLSMVSTSSYTNNGNLLSTGVDANNNAVNYQYGNAVSQMLGSPTAVVGANNTSTHFTYDNFGRTTQTVVAGQAGIAYNYVEGNLYHISRGDNRQNTQLYTMPHDTFGNMTSFAVGNRTLVTYEYGSGNGQLVKQTYANGDAVTYTYDKLDRLATETYADGRVVTYTYNGEGQLHSVKETGGDAPATYLYTYDSVGNLIASEKKNTNGETVLRVYQNYDSTGQLAGQSWYVGNIGYSEIYSYNTSDGSLSSMATATGETLQFGYDDLQRLTVVGNGLYTKNYSYRNVSDIRTTTQVSQVQYTGLPAALTYGYTYDAVGNIATYSAPGQGTVTYTYDALGQLLSAVGDETYRYTYDSAGNILTANGHKYTYGSTAWQDLLMGYDGVRFSYDAIGNPTGYYNGTRWNFAWENGRNLMFATDGTTDLSFAYDANGLRTSKTVGGLTHNYFYAGGQLLRETYTGATLDFFYDTEGKPYALKYNGTTYYYITNLQGDVMYLIDAQGNTVASYEYDPYGNIVSATGTMAQINPLRYRGYYYDAELEMYYLQSRYYDPQIGRFINTDDISYLGMNNSISSFNLFTYCANSPNNYSDAEGKWAEKFTGFITTEVGFNVNYSAAFLSRHVCLSYASDVIKLYGGWSWWYGRSYKKMNSTRIAKELYGHAILYQIGIGAMVSSVAIAVLDALIIKFAGIDALKPLSSINQKIAYLQYNMGFYLFDHSRYIEVNNNEKWYRLIAFNIIWRIVK